MRVRDLIEILEDCDPDATVYLMYQPNYPLQCTVAGAVKREEFQDCDDEESSESPEDVFILEGSSSGYGSKAAWNAT